MKNHNYFEYYLNKNLYWFLTHKQGTTKYAMSSSICQAAIHNGDVAASNGGSLTFNIIDFTDKNFYGSAQHGIESS